MTTFPTITTQVYDKDYFSGSQVSIYIGDVMIDEITGLEFTYTQNKVPHYGWASQRFDALAPGIEIIQGTFSINFKESAYLLLVLSRFFSKNRNPLLRNLNDKGGGAGVDNEGQRKLTRTNIENLLRLVNQGNNNASDGEGLNKNGISTDLPDKSIDLLRQLAFGFPNISDAADKNSLGIAEDVFEYFEDRIWNDSNETLLSQPRTALNNKYDLFDIHIVYGDYNAPNNAVNHTVNKLVGVSIVGMGKSHEVSGRPIQETYQFIAKSMI